MMLGWQRNTLVALLLLVWAGGIAWAFWWFEAQYLRNFDRQAFFQGIEVEPPFATGQIQVLHVWQANCPCSAGHEAYVEEMTQRFSAQGVRFARSGQTTTDGLGVVLKNLPYWPIPEAWGHWPGAPSIAIWDADGVLSYVGPYSDGAHCSSDTSFVEPVLQRLLAGGSVSITRQDTVSCLCELRE
ncbi:MAG: thiol-disulfide isomerase [Pseudomonadaceae bacterium]|nr:MAG: thiol-disulfide isomerase [Pseudomonadaceae bacterium]